jgi:hypothetical protein
MARKGINDNILSLLKDFCDKENLRPLKLIINQLDSDWANSNITFIHKSFS